MIASITKTLTSSVEIQAALDAARADAAEADAAMAAAERAYTAGLLTETPDALRKLVDEKLTHQISADRGRAIVKKLEADLEKALAAEAEDGRTKRYTDAKALAEAAREKLFDSYPKAAEAIREILRAVAEADIAIASVNEDLPSGATRLEKPEDSRSTAREWGEELSRDNVMLWATIDSNSPIADDRQRQVQHQGGKNRNGYARGYLPQGDGSIECELRPFVRIRSLPDRNGWSAKALASNIALPGLEGGDSDFWEPTEGGATYVLSELDKPLRKRPPYKPREPVFSYSPIRE